MTSQDDIGVDDLKQLFEIALISSYKVKECDSKTEIFMFNCLKLFEKDYIYAVVNNTNGDLCAHYPSKIVILEYLKGGGGKSAEKVQSIYDVSSLRELFHKARFARCRSRFAVPVILFEGKHICRGATLSGGAEIYGRSSFDFFVTGGESIPPEQRTQSRGSSDWQLFDRIRGQDISLLKQFAIGYICDLMVEKKKVKFGMNVTSSEKVDKENRYSDFTILTVPYPGCEFFREWRDNGFMADGMKFDWTQGYVDAKLELPGHIEPPLAIEWSSYKKWDLVLLTQNYLKLFIHYAIKGENGMLIHCISGWDRTPLFIALLRLSLWADMAIHPSLGPLDILYLTISYDWFLFGHNFNERMAKGEDIFFFCFHFLKYITSEDFSISKIRKATTSVNRIDSDSVIEGILLDSELHHVGSNISINSISSVNSTKSSVDNGPALFTLGTSPEEDFIKNGASSNILSPAINTSTSASAPTSSLIQIGEKQGIDSGSPHKKPPTVPISVPSSHRNREFKSSVSGSWQLISECGSVRGSTGDQSPHSQPSSDGQSNSGSKSKIHHKSCDCGGHSAVADNDDSTRKQRLDAVRQLFLRHYTEQLDPHTLADQAQSAGATGFSGLVGNFAEKLGIKSSKSSLV